MAMLMTYAGGKNGCGSYQRIINHMPPHRVYIEGFCGSGAVIRNKKPATTNIAIDLSDKALGLCQSLFQSDCEVEFYNRDTLWLLPILTTSNSKQPVIDDPQALIYLDPPYLSSTRKSGDLYDYEMSFADHVTLLDMISNRSSMIMISGYRSSLYDKCLAGWHRVDYRTMTRQGMVDESLWINFPFPVALHDYSHLGENFRERERIKRKKERWKKKINTMDQLEKLAIMEILQGQF